MPKFVVVCSRDPELPVASRAAEACAQLAPDNLPQPQVAVRSSPGLTIAVLSASRAVRLGEGAMCVGSLLDAPADWQRPGSSVPDGSFALVRADDACVEIATDPVGSRTVFYAMNDELFVASSSQRAIATILGRFALDPVAVSWMLSTGALGPRTWDERTVRMAPDETLRLGRTTWNVERRRGTVEFRERRASDREHAACLEDAARSACAAVDLEHGKWRLPLSGGYDSRFLLLSLAPTRDVRCVTWGLPSSLDDPGNDAFIARELARKVGVPHEYFPVQQSSEGAATLLDRFLVNGEGCVDHIGAYLDGFEIWRRLHAEGTEQIVRGDQGCGWDSVAIESDVRRGLGALMLTDVFPARTLVAWGLAEQRWPEEHRRRDGESLAAWRDRLYLTYRVPVVLASLTELKASYVDVVSPLLSRRVLQVVQALPDRLRDDKRLFRSVVEAMSPPIPFAIRNAIPSLQTVVNTADFLSLARAEIEAGLEEGALPRGFGEWLRRSMPAATDGSVAPRRADARRTLQDRVRGWARARTPLVVKSAIAAARRSPPSIGALAFRAAIVSRMARTLTRAAAKR